MSRKDKDRLNLYIDSDLKKQLEKRAEQERRSANAQAVLFIEQGLCDRWTCTCGAHHHADDGGCLVCRDVRREGDGD